MTSAMGMCRGFVVSKHVIYIHTLNLHVLHPTSLYIIDKTAWSRLRIFISLPSFLALPKNL